MDSVSGVGVLDKAMVVLAALEDGPRTLAELVDGHRPVAGDRPPAGRRPRGPRPGAARRRRPVLARPAAHRPRPRRGRGGARAGSTPARRWRGCREQTGESVQLFVRDGDVRVCVESLESPHELRTIVPVGARLPLDRGSAGRSCGPGAAGRPAGLGRERGRAPAGRGVGERPGRRPVGPGRRRGQRQRPDRPHLPLARAAATAPRWSRPPPASRPRSPERRHASRRPRYRQNTNTKKTDNSHASPDRHRLWVTHHIGTHASNIARKAAT